MAWSDRNNHPALVGSIWQNPLDYSAYLSFFTDIVISSGFETAIEAFTVIENSMEHVSETAKDESLRKIEKAQANDAGARKELLDQLFTVVSAF